MRILLYMFILVHFLIYKVFLHALRLAGGGAQPCGCQSWGCVAAPQGESFGSFFTRFLAVTAGPSSVGGAGEWCGISCDSSCSLSGEGVSLLMRAGLLLAGATPLVGSRDCSICKGCCLSGASSAEGLDAHRSSACAASTFIRSWRAASCFCSAKEGGSYRVCRSHCIHDAITLSVAARSLQDEDATHEIS